MMALDKMLRVLVTVLLLCCGSAHAQLGSTNNGEPPAAPSPLQLGSSWWSYLGGAGEQDLDERIGTLLANAEAEVGQLTVADGADLSGPITALRQQLRVYEQLRYQEAPTAAPAVRLEGAFTTDQLFDVITAREQTAADVAALREQLAERQRSFEAQSDQLEALFSRYPRTPERSVERLRLGLQVMLQRTTVAIAAARAGRTEQELQIEQQFAADLAKQLAYARDHLELSEEDPETLRAVVEQADAAAQAAAARIAEAQDAVLSIDPSQERQVTQAQLRLSAAEIDRQMARLARALATSRLRWLALHGLTEGPKNDELRAEIDQWNELTATTAAAVEPWRTLAVSVLLHQPRVESERSQQARREDDRLRQLAQQSLAKIRDIELDASLLDVLAQAVELKLAAEQGPLQQFWIESMIMLESLWEGSVSILNTRLFSIGDTPVTTMGIARIILILVVAFWISVLLRRALDRISHSRAFISVSSIYTLGRLLHYVIMIGALLIGLGSIGLDFSNLALIAGALSVGIGFGLQSIVNNFVSGLILLFERSLKVGDYVELDNGLTGYVREINIRSTRINTNDNIDVLVPNSEFVTTRLTNWTLRESLARMRIPFGVSYDSDKEKVRELALEAADRVDFTLKNMPGKAPEVWLVNFGDSSLDFELLVWVSRKGVARPGRIQATYLWELHTLFTENDIEIPYPQRDIHVRTPGPSG